MLNVILLMFICMTINVLKTDFQYFDNKMNKYGINMMYRQTYHISTKSLSHSEVKELLW